MKKIPPKSKAQTAITDEQWTEVWHKLRLHTWKRYRWLHNLTGEDLDDVAHQAISDTLNGIRDWPPIDSRTGHINEKVSLFSFLCGVVRSIVSHRWRREKKAISISYSAGNSHSELPYQKSIDALLSETGQILPHLVSSEDIENQTLYNQITSMMRELVADDKEVYEIVDLWCNDPSLKPHEIAHELGLSISQMYAAQKRLRRRLKGLREGPNND